MEELPSDGPFVVAVPIGSPLPNGGGISDHASGPAFASLQEALKFVDDVRPNADLAIIRSAGGRVLGPRDIARLIQEYRAEKDCAAP